MPRKTKSKSPPRKRRTAEEARAAILDAAERRLVLSGPAGIRLQEVAEDVGVSHPTVLHHFGNREALIEAVVARALDSLHAGLLDALKQSAPGPNEVLRMLERVSSALVDGGHARAFLWLALSGYHTGVDDLRIRSLAEAVQEVRTVRRAEKKKTAPAFDDTYFTLLMPALALMTLSVIEQAAPTKKNDALTPAKFRAWLGKLIHEHLER